MSGAKVVSKVGCSGQTFLFDALCAAATQNELVQLVQRISQCPIAALRSMTLSGLNFPDSATGIDGKSIDFGVLLKASGFHLLVETWQRSQSETEHSQARLLTEEQVPFSSSNVPVLLKPWSCSVDELSISLFASAHRHLEQLNERDSLDLPRIDNYDSLVVGCKRALEQYQERWESFRDNSPEIVSLLYGEGCADGPVAVLQAAISLSPSLTRRPIRISAPWISPPQLSSETGEYFASGSSCVFVLSVDGLFIQPREGKGKENSALPLRGPRADDFENMRQAGVDRASLCRTIAKVAWRLGDHLKKEGRGADPLVSDLLKLEDLPQSLAA